jgi:hypothetical protein
MRKKTLWVVIILLGIIRVPLFSQTTEGKDFWLTFGENDYSYDNPNLQIRVATKEATNVRITFTELGSSSTITPPIIAAGEVYTLTLGGSQKSAVYLNKNATGLSSKSMRIESDQPVTVFAFNQNDWSSDATNVLPVNALGKEYYQISYIASTNTQDGYHIIATEDGTLVTANGTSVSMNAGQVLSVYTTGQAGDLTGRYTTSNKPVAFFATNGGAFIPSNSEGSLGGFLTGNSDNLFQQMLSVRTWGKNFCIPVTKRGVERIRILASQDGTIISHQGGIVKTYPAPGKGSLNLNKGEFVEMEISAGTGASIGGCFISSNKPVGICSYLIGMGYNGFVNGNMVAGDPAMAWIPPVEQFVKSTTIAPFMPTSLTKLTDHHALLVMATDGRDQTTVSVGGTLIGLSGGMWITSPNPEYSYYDLPMTADKSYTFANPNGLAILGYGLGDSETYYYLAASATRDLEGAFYVNGESYLDVNGKRYCGVSTFHIQSVLAYQNPDPGSLVWYVDGVQRNDLTDQSEWDLTNLQPGSHTIEMRARDLNNVFYSYETTISLCPLRIPVNQRN